MVDDLTGSGAGYVDLQADERRVDSEGVSAARDDRLYQRRRSDELRGLPDRFSPWAGGSKSTPSRHVAAPKWRRAQPMLCRSRAAEPLAGFRARDEPRSLRSASSVVYYDRTPRFAGESKYPLRKEVALALDAITSFSVVQLRLVTLAGFLVFLCSLAVTVWALWLRFVTQSAIPGWTSIVLPMYFLGGIQLFCIGMIGEYLGKVYSEVKARPRYCIERVASRSLPRKLADETRVGCSVAEA